jgi:DNA-binding SARP family transcriptional activator/Tol biopolymer transport system component
MSGDRGKPLWDRIGSRESQARHMTNGTTVKPLPGANIRLRTLGRAALVAQVGDRDAVELLGPGKPLAVLVYLSRSPQQTASRDHLLDLLWADHEPDAARHALRQAVWYLRKRIGDEALEAGDGSVRLVAPLETDDRLFEAAIAAGDLEAAIDCYHGPFLPDIAVPGGARLEQWVDSVRLHLQSLFFRTAESVVRDRLSQGRTRDARELANQVRDANRLDEVGWRLVLEALCSAGDWVTAGVEADELERLLAREGRRPEPATTAALERARQVSTRDGATRPRTTLVAELVGREREFARVIAGWEQARNGPGVHLHVAGGTGLGKTRLLQDLHSRLLTVGARVVYVNANPGTRHVAYSYASDLAHALCQLPGAASVSPACAGILIGLNPALSAVYNQRPDTSSHDAARKYLIALKDLLAGVADEQPVAVFVDDLHWVDQPSLSLLAGLIGSVPDSRVLLVTTARPTHDGFAPEPARTIELQPLTQDQVLSLLSGLGRLPDERWAETLPELIHRATGGSPLLLLETLQLSLEQGRLGLEQGEWACSDPDALQTELEEGGALKRRIVELRREQSWLLLLLAAAGTPLSRTVLAELVNRPGESFESDLIELEKKGFIARAGEQYRVAHDEIAELALETTPPEAASAAFAAIGEVLLEFGWNELGLLTQSGPYLARAGDAERLRTAFRRKVWLARSRGDRRSLLELAREASGTVAGNGQAAKLVKRLPVYMRLGLSSPRRVAATASVATVLALGAIALWLAPAGPPADMNFMLFEQGYESSRMVFAAELRREGWDQLEKIGLSRQLLRRETRFTGRNMTVPLPNPHGTMWAVSHHSGDSGGTDVFVRDGRGHEERLTNAPGDDKPYSWSPDGKQLAITTARWSHRSIYELAMLDVSTRQLKRLTNTDALEMQPVWSPDGTRIAFVRQGSGGIPVELCWMAVDGSASSCLSQRQFRIRELMNWADDGSLLLLGSDSAGDNWIVSLLPDSGKFVSLARAGSERASALSPDSKWVACYCEMGGEHPQWRIFPLDDPTQSRPVDVDHTMPEGLLPVWRPTQNSRHYLDRIEAQAPQEVPMGVPLLLRFVAQDESGQPTTPQIVQWISLDTSIAAVDAGGVLYGKRAGEAAVAVSAAGWRADSVTIQVIEPAPRTVLQEAWREDWAERWRFYGDPTPRVLLGPDSVPAFWNANDEKYTSGVYSRSEWTVTRGLGVEAKVSSPITIANQQVLYLWLEGSLETRGLAAWDHQTGYLPGRSEYSNRRCDTGIGRRPDEDRTFLAVVSGGDRVEVPLESPLGSTQWHDLRLQIFPDGTCGAALDGVPLARTTTKMPLDGTYRVITEGRSIDTQLLVGPLEVWEGVRTDVDWAALPDWPRSRAPME